MKVGIDLKPKSGSANLVVKSTRKSPRFFRSRRNRLLLLGAVFVCAMGVWIVTQVSTMASNAVAKPGFVPEPIPVGEEVVVVKSEEIKTETVKPRGWLRKVLAKVSPQEPPPSRVLAYDGSRVLSRGEKVVVHFDGQVTVAEVAGAPNESVLLRRGQAPERLYVLGDSSYAVMANQQSKIVRASDIYATVTPPMEIASN